MAVRVLTLLIVVALIPLLIFGAIAIYASNTSLTAEVQEANLEVARQAVILLESELAGVQARLEATIQAGGFHTMDVEQQRTVLRALHRDLPDVRTLAVLGTTGDELLKVSSRETFGPHDLTNRATAPEFQAAMAGNPHFGQVRDSAEGEPFVDLALPIRSLAGNQIVGVAIAEVSLRNLLNSVINLQQERPAQIFIVDDTGRVLAHPNHSLVLAGAVLSDNPRVRDFRAGVTTISTAPYLSEGVELIGVQARSNRLNWGVIVEEPTVAALAPIAAIQSSLLIGLGVIVLLLVAAGFYLTIQVARPLTQLTQTTQALAGGDLSQQVTITGRDEIGLLAQSFNRMAEQLREVFGSLEKRVSDRTRALQTSAEISRRITTILELDELLHFVVHQIQQEFGFYHVHIYLIDRETDELVMAEGYGEVGRQLRAKEHRLQMGQGIVGTTASTAIHFLSNNVDEVLNFVRNPLLPNTHSELAVPLRKGEQVLGVLDIQSEQVNRFTEDDVALMQSIADQTAVAVDNVRLLAETQAALQEVERLNRRLTHTVWTEFTTAEKAAIGYHFAANRIAPLNPDSRVWLSPMHEAARKKNLVKQVEQEGSQNRAELAVPLMLRGEVIGVLGVKREQSPDWASEELAVVESVANQVALALENARLSKEQEKTIVQLKDIDRLKDEFLTSMSHELRTPLNSIIGFADILLQGIDGELNETALNDIQLIYNSGQHLLALINDILDLSKIGAGKMELVREKLPLEEIIKDVLSASSSLVQGKPVTIEVEMPEGLPLVYADKLRLSQIILNLVSNAAKFTEKGTITLKAGVKRDEPGKMLIEIQDSGIGIPKAKLATIFERFSQADSSTSRKYGGTGLGLAICVELIKMHGGEIGVASEEGHGSNFYFTVPLAPPES
jgi:signal transduction histidine kinase/HAMP domain-containing protein